MTKTVRHKVVRQALQDRISSGVFVEGDRLPSERDFQVEFDCSRSVIRQALGALARDGWIMPVYPKGYEVLGPRIPWISRFELLGSDSWKVDLTDIGEVEADQDVADSLGVEVGSKVISRDSLLTGKDGGPWGMGRVFYPEDELTAMGREALLSDPELTYDDLESAFKRKILGFKEQIKSRRPTKSECETLGISKSTWVFEMRRLARTSTDKPVSFFVFIGRTDKFQLSYSIQND